MIRALIASRDPLVTVAQVVARLFVQLHLGDREIIGQVPQRRGRNTPGPVNLMAP